MWVSCLSFLPPLPRKRLGLSDRQVRGSCVDRYLQKSVNQAYV